MLVVTTLLLLGLGLLALLFPDQCANRISAFYRRYPLIRHAPDRQFGLHPNYVRAMGATIVACVIVVFVLG